MRVLREGMPSQSISYRLVVTLAAGAAFLVTIHSACPPGSCFVDDDCIVGVCSNGSCVECAADGDCDDDELCDDGECINLECTVDADCEGGGHCARGRCDGGTGEGEGEGEGDGGEGEGDGNCTTRCDCAAGLACIAGLCTSPPGFCASDDECPRGTTTCAETICNGFFCSTPSEGEGEGEGEGDVGPQTLRLTIQWDTNDTDVDIHVTKGNAGQQFCVRSPNNNGTPAVTVGPQAEVCATAPLECDFSNCKNNPLVEWDGAAGHSAGDPAIDIDDLDGLGPEQVSVQALAPGEYLLSTYFYTAGSGFGTATPTHVTSRAFFGTSASPLYTSTPALLDATHIWVDVAIVVKGPTGAPCVEDLLDGNAADDCP